MRATNAETVAGDVRAELLGVDVERTRLRRRGLIQPRVPHVVSAARELRRLLTRDHRTTRGVVLARVRRVREPADRDTERRELDANVAQANTQLAVRRACVALAGLRHQDRVEDEIGEERDRVSPDREHLLGFDERTRALDRLGEVLLFFEDPHDRPDTFASNSGVSSLSQFSSRSDS
jgi:hypothetical protein